MRQCEKSEGCLRSNDCHENGAGYAHNRICPHCGHCQECEKAPGSTVEPV